MSLSFRFPRSESSKNEPVLRSHEQDFLKRVSQDERKVDQYGEPARKYDAGELEAQVEWWLASQKFDWDPQRESFPKSMESFLLKFAQEVRDQFPIAQGGNGICSLHQQIMNMSITQLKDEKVTRELRRLMNQTRNEVRSGQRETGVEEDVVLTMKDYFEDARRVHKEKAGYLDCKYVTAFCGVLLQNLFKSANYAANVEFAAVGDGPHVRLLITLPREQKGKLPFRGRTNMKEKPLQYVLDFLARPLDKQPGLKRGIRLYNSSDTKWAKILSSNLLRVFPINGEGLQVLDYMFFINLEKEEQQANASRVESLQDE